MQDKTNPYWAWNRLAAGAITLIAIVLTWSQTANFPFPPFTDAICFLPQAVAFAQEDGMRNVYIFRYLPDGDYVWHGFLLPLVLGGLFKTTTYPEVTTALAVLNGLTVIAVAFIVLRLTASWPIFLRMLLLSASLLTQSGFLGGLLGRPEAMSALLIAVGVLIWTLQPSKVAYLGLGGVIGLLAVTSPATAIIASGCLASAMLARDNMFGTLLLSGIFVILGAVAAVSVGFTFYPYSIAQWLWGLEQHASAVVYVREGWLNLDRLLRAYVISTGRLMMGGIFLVVVALTIYHLWRTQEARKVQKFGSIGLVVCVAALAVRFTTISGFYNMLCLFPIGVAVAASTLGTQSYSLNTVGKLLKNCFFACLLISTADPLLLQLGSLLGYKGMPFLEARRLFSNDMKTMPGDITLSMDLAVLSDRTDRLQTIYKYVPPCEEPDTPWLVVQQFSYSYSKPPSYTSYRLVKNRFVDIKKMPGRLQQWFGAPGYGYAIYRKEDRQGASRH